MRGKTLALLILALGCGLVASLGITQVLAKRGDPAPTGDTASVYVARADIPLGTVATSDLLKVEQWPKDHIPSGALGRAEDVEGRRARYRIFAGQPILDPMLLHAGEMPIDAQIPVGMRVVPVPVSPEAIHSGLVVPGSRCDVQVFIRADAGLGIAETLSKTILQDIRVFAVNDITSTQSNDPKTPEQRSIPSGRTVSLLVTPQQAEIVTIASQLGAIRLILRSAEDNVQTKMKQLTIREVLGGSSGANRDLENKEAKEAQNFAKWFDVMKEGLKRSAAASQPSPVRPKEPAKFQMRVRSGTDVNDVLMIADGANEYGDDVTWTAMNLPTQTKSAPESHATKAADIIPAGNSASGSAVKPQSETPQPTLKVNGKPPMGS